MAAASISSSSSVKRKSNCPPWLASRRVGRTAPRRDTRRARRPRSGRGDVSVCFGPAILVDFESRATELFAPRYHSPSITSTLLTMISAMSKYFFSRRAVRALEALRCWSAEGRRQRKQVGARLPASMSALAVARRPSAVDAEEIVDRRLVLDVALSCRMVTRSGRGGRSRCNADCSTHRASAGALRRRVSGLALAGGMKSCWTIFQTARHCRACRRVSGREQRIGTKLPSFASPLWQSKQRARQDGGDRFGVSAAAWRRWCSRRQRVQTERDGLRPSRSFDELEPARSPTRTALRGRRAKRESDDARSKPPRRSPLGCLP